MRDFYAAERTMELLKSVEKRIPRAKPEELEELLQLLESLATGERDPRVIKLVYDARSLRKILARLGNKRECEARVAVVLTEIAAWERLLQEALAPNRQLGDLPEPDAQFFFAYVRELNPVTLKTMHQVNEVQLADIRKRSNEELLAYDPVDPITGYRQFRDNDNGAYPGSRIVLTAGHHRVFELYRRFMNGALPGDTLVRIKKSQ